MRDGSKSIVIVGSGPVGALAASWWRRRGFEVDVYDQGKDPRRRKPRGHSFNLTLTLRGLSSLVPSELQRVRELGVVLPQRVIHHSDESITEQAYGTHPEHYLLSVPRNRLHLALLDEASSLGVRFHFERECLSVDTDRTTVLIADKDRTVKTHSAALIVGCDGAGSQVRQAISRGGAQMDSSQKYIRHGYVEALMPAAADGGHQLRCTAFSAEHGMHIWPRGEHFLLAQPNTDGTYTTTLFMPLKGEGQGPRLQALDSEAAMLRHLAEDYPDLARHHPCLAEQFTQRPPASLRIVQCRPIRHHQVVLMGDAAHTTAPFYGQGINCSFEDVAAFFTRFDATWADADRSIGEVFDEVLAGYEEERAPEGEHVADLSMRNLAELGSHVDDAAFHQRKAIERRLALEESDHFVPLYTMVAFTRMPYSEAIERATAQDDLLDRACAGPGGMDDQDAVIAEYVALARGDKTSPSEATPSRRLQDGLTPAEWEALRIRVETYRAGLAKGTTPASYIQNSLDVMSYEHGREAAGRLRVAEPPWIGRSVDNVMDKIFEEALTNGTQHGHPGFLG